MLDAALDYASRGLRVLPLHSVQAGCCTCGWQDCESLGKHPRTPHGVKDASTDESVIRSWWRRWPSANVGVATGRGVVVFDADGPEGVDSLKALGVPATTWLARTGGGGLHLWLASPHGVPNRVALLPSLDVRGDGGYVVAPPSLHASGSRYEWLTAPHHLALAQASGAARRVLLSAPNGNGRAGAILEPDAPIPTGQRNDTLYRRGRSLAAKGWSPEAIRAALDAENAARCVPPLPASEVATIAEHVVSQPHAPGFEMMTDEQARQYAESHRARKAAVKSTVIRSSTGAAKRAVLQTLADIEAKPVEYLWPPRVPRGKLVALIGDPGLGKSLLTLDIAARISTGGSWPDGGHAPKGDVIVLSAEDGVADTIRPRLDVMGGDAARVYVLSAIKDRTIERGVDLSHDVAQLEEAVIAKSAVLTVIDPVDAYLGGQVDSHKNASVRRVLAPLAALADRTGVAVLMVMHLSKAEDRRALYRALGSVGFVAASRSVLAVGADPDDAERRVVVPVKSNVSAQALALAYRVVGVCPTCRAVAPEPTCSLCGVGSVACLQWCDDPVQPVTADELLGASGAGAERSEPRQEAREFLLEVLGDGDEVESRELLKAAAENGIARRTLFRAKKEVGVRARRDGRARRWLWSLGMPPETARRYAESRARKSATDGQEPTCDTVGTLGTLSEFRAFQGKSAKGATSATYGVVGGSGTLDDAEGAS